MSFYNTTTVMPFHQNIRYPHDCSYCPSKTSRDRILPFHPMRNYADSAVNARMISYNMPAMQNVLDYRALNKPRRTDLFHMTTCPTRFTPCSTCYGTRNDVYQRPSGKNCFHCGQTAFSDRCP